MTTQTNGHTFSSLFPSSPAAAQAEAKSTPITQAPAGGNAEATDMARVLAEIEALRKENATLKARKATGVTMKVSEKGAVSVYGLGRFPVTLYRGQWEKLFGMVDAIKEFILANEGLLSVKGE